MEDAFASGRIVDIILALVALEVIVLLAYRARTGRGITGVDLAISLASGIGLMLALRASLTGQAWPAIAPWLALSGIAHYADLWRRWPR